MTEKEIRFIFDKIYKRVITLSSKAVIGFINGIFGTDYPEDSSITYNWTESVSDSLERKLADTIITINGAHSYHIEAQMENDDDIVFRMFDYGHRHARNYPQNESGKYTLYFPEPKVLYIYSEGVVPEKYTLRLDFGSQGHFDYEVSTFDFQKISIEELKQKKLFILIPFLLLKLRRLIMKNPTPENIQLLKNLVNNDILSSIEENKINGSISISDAVVLYRLTVQLYNQLYTRNPEMEEFDDMFDHSLMLDCGIVLDCDVMLDKIEMTERRLKATEENLKTTEENLKTTEENLKATEENLKTTEENLKITQESLEATERERDAALDEVERLKRKLAEQIEQLRAELENCK